MALTNNRIYQPFYGISRKHAEINTNKLSLSTGPLWDTPGGSRQRNIQIGLLYIRFYHNKSIPSSYLQKKFYLPIRDPFSISHSDYILFFDRAILVLILTAPKFSTRVKNCEHSSHYFGSNYINSSSQSHLRV